MVHLQTVNIGWAKNINNKLAKYQLETNWEDIGKKSKREWKRIVEEAVDKMNQNKIIQNYTTETPNGLKINTKTKTIHE